MPQKNHRDALTNAILDETSFVRATFKGKAGNAGTPWKRVVVRPVLIKGARHLQFSYFDATRDITKNYQGDEACSKLDELFALPFGSVHVENTTGDIDVQFGKGGTS